MLHDQRPLRVVWARGADRGDGKGALDATLHRMYLLIHAVLDNRIHALGRVVISYCRVWTLTRPNKHTDAHTPPQAS